MRSLVLFLSLVSFSLGTDTDRQVTPLVGQDGALFVYQNEIILSHDTWLLSFSMKLQPYNEQMSSIRDEIKVLEDGVNSYSTELENVNSSLSLHFNDHILLLFRQELIQLKITFREVKTNYKEIVSIFGQRSNAPRPKRSLIPIVGSVLSSLFGVVSQGDMKHISRNMNKLVGRTNALAHILNESLSIMDHTRDEVQANRQAVNKMGRMLNDLHENVRILYDITSQTLPAEIRLRQFTDEIHSVFNLASNTLHRLSYSINDLKFGLESALLGHLSSKLLSPDELVRMLKAARRRFPEGYNLPYPLQQLDMYYQNIPISVITVRDSAVVTLVLPIYRNSDLFHLSKLVQVPILVGDNHAIQYSLQNYYLAISDTEGTYFELNDFQASLCGKSTINFCKLSAATFRKDTQPSCLTAIFDRDTYLIQNYCSVTDMPVNVPRVELLFDNNWIVYAPEELKLDLNCFHGDVSQQHPIYIHKGSSIFSVPENCQAFGKYFNIPIQFRAHSTRHINQLFELQIANIKHLFEQSDWSFNVMMPNETFPPLPSFSDDDRSTLDNVKRQMKEMADVPSLEQTGKTWFWLLIPVAILLLLVLVAIIAFLIRELRVRRTRDLSTYRSRGADEEGLQTMSTALPAPVENQEEQELDVSIVQVN